MIEFRLVGVLCCASLVALTGCGGSGSSDSANTGTSVAANLSQSAGAPVVAVGAAAQSAEVKESLASREQVVIESKISAGTDTAVNPFKSMSLRKLPTAAQIRLGPLADESAALLKSSVADSHAAAGLNVPTKVGVGRRIAEAASAEQVGALLGWSPSAEGDALVSALRFESSGAKGIRLGVKIESLPLVAMVRFYADGVHEMYEVSSQEILSSIQRNLDAGDSGDAAHTYWSPNLGGEAITMEIEIPKRTAVDTVQVSVPSLSHALINTKKLDSIAKIGEAGACTRDVSCSTAYNEISKSVALMEFVQSDGATYVCTGTLLNDRMSSGIPYFLSANHCVPSQSVASTLYTLWFYRSASCNSTEVSPTAFVVSAGATLLYASANTDTSFMRLNSSPPAGVVYAGTSPFEMAPSDAVYGVSHPQGDLQKYSNGVFRTTASCNLVSCSVSPASNASFLQVNWLQGATESGSSGSGLFTKLNGKDYLVGQLFGGYGSCSNPSGAEFYGRFDKAYNAALFQWLGATSGTVRMPIYRLYNRSTATHFYTASAAERDHAVEKLGTFNYEGIAFYAYGASGTVTDSVYRFYDNRTGVHFYTINPIERDSVIRNLPSYSYEGTSWFAGASPLGQSTAMYRFYNNSTGTHFYTINSAERDNIIRTLPNYTFEGVSYYAWLSP